MMHVLTIVRRRCTLSLFAFFFCNRLYWIILFRGLVPARWLWSMCTCVVHFTSDCTHLMCLHALQLSRVGLKRYFIFIYPVGQKTPRFKWISTSISPHSVFSRSYWGPWRPSAPSSWTTVLRFITARSICWRTACMTNPCQRTRARLKGWKSWSPTTRSAPDEGQWGRETGLWHHSSM